MKIAIGADHAGFALKEEIAEYLRSEGHEVLDLGTHSTASVDYPTLGKAVAEAVAKGETERGFLVCGTGVGMSIVANKVAGVRAAACSDSFSAEMARAHNDANVLALGSRVVGPGLALKLVGVFLETTFEGGRHQRRVDQIKDLDRPR